MTEPRVPKSEPERKLGPYVTFQDADASEVLHLAGDYVGAHYAEGNPDAITVSWSEEGWSLTVYGDWEDQGL